MLKEWKVDFYFKLYFVLIYKKNISDKTNNYPQKRKLLDLDQNEHILDESQTKKVVFPPPYHSSPHDRKNIYIQ